MLFIGDSTVEQAASVLMNSVQMGYWGTGETSCATSISVADADTLFHLDLGRYNRGWTVPDAIREARQPEIVVLSAGAHVYGQDNFTRLLRHVAGSARRITRNASLIWMTTLPGGCGTSSLDEPPAATPGFWTALGARGMKLFNWAELEGFARIARDFWAANGEACVLDTSPLARRVDAHVGSPRGDEATKWANASAWGENRKKLETRDCLHWCVPGPLSSLVPRLLLNLLESRPRCGRQL